MYRKFGKRTLDLILVIPGLIITFPLLIIISTLVCLKMDKPVLFRQTRPGRNGRPFTLYKFRTMLDTRDENNELLPAEYRVTKFGKFLRNYSLDELPGLWNVLKGDMSFVGPRPLLMEYLDRYTSEQARRHEVKPGVTGWAQVNGRNAITWEEKFAFDIWYVDHYSFFVDIKIIFKTFLKVLKREGISPDGKEIMPEFKGKIKNDSYAN